MNLILLLLELALDFYTNPLVCFLKRNFQYSKLEITAIILKTKNNKKNIFL